MDEPTFKRIECSDARKGPDPWKTSHDELWHCDEPFTDEIAAKLIEGHLTGFPIVGTSYEVLGDRGDGHLLSVHVIEDSCM